MTSKALNTPINVISSTSTVITKFLIFFSTLSAIKDNIVINVLSIIKNSDIPSIPI